MTLWPDQWNDAVGTISTPFGDIMVYRISNGTTLVHTVSVGANTEAFPVAPDPGIVEDIAAFMKVATTSRPPPPRPRRFRCIPPRRVRRSPQRSSIRSRAAGSPSWARRR